MDTRQTKASRDTKIPLRLLGAFLLPVLLGGAFIITQSACRPRQDGTRSVSSTKHTQLPNRGGGGGAAFQFNCDDNEVLTGIKGTDVLTRRASKVIQSVEFECREMTALGLPGDVGATSGVYGGSGGDPFDGPCPSGTMVNGIHGNSGDLIDGMGVYCATLNEVMDGTTVQELYENEVGPFGGFGAWRLPHGPEDFWDDVCPLGYVGTGVKGRAGAALDRVSLRCSKIESSNLKPGCSLDSESEFLLPWHGESGNGVESKICPAGSVVTGVKGRAGAIIDKLEFVCSSFDACNGGVGEVVGTTSHPYSGDGGAPFEGACPPNTVANRVFGRSGRVLDQVGLYCTSLQGAVGGYGGYVVGPWGGNGGDFLYDSCPAGFVLTGARGVFHGMIWNFRFHCTKIEEVPVRP